MNKSNYSHSKTEEQHMADQPQDAQLDPDQKFGVEGGDLLYRMILEAFTREPK